jgi:hypothetical protein
MRCSFGLFGVDQQRHGLSRGRQRRQQMRILRSVGRWAVAGGLMLALGTMAWSQQTGGSGNGGMTGQGTGTMSGQGNGGMGGQGSSGVGGQGSASSSGRGTNPLSSLPGDEPTIPPQMEEQQAKLRNLERQKKLQEDTAKLLSLANELKADVDKSTKDTLSLEVVRKADEIEKLAHSVKEKMKGT